MTTTTAERTRAAQGPKRVGYVVAVALNLVMLFLIHAWPGWDVIPFLTDRTTDVLPYVDASIMTTILVNTLYLVRDVRDDRAAKAWGDLVINLVSMLSLIRFWQVLPVDFDGVWGGWQPLTYVLLPLATIGTAIAALVPVTALVRRAVGHTD